MKLTMVTIDVPTCSPCRVSTVVADRLAVTDAAIPAGRALLVTKRVALE
jgi:hypothetical protein